VRSWQVQQGSGQKEISSVLSLSIGKHQNKKARSGVEMNWEEPEVRKPGAEGRASMIITQCKVMIKVLEI
jgi:hypothetical protein